LHAPCLVAMVQFAPQGTPCLVNPWHAPVRGIAQHANQGNDVQAKLAMR